MTISMSHSLFCRFFIYNSLFASASVKRPNINISNVIYVTSAPFHLTLASPSCAKTPPSSWHENQGWDEQKQEWVFKEFMSPEFMLQEMATLQLRVTFRWKSGASIGVWGLPQRILLLKEDWLSLLLWQWRSERDGISFSSAPWT